MPLTSKGQEILTNLEKEYGAEKAKQVLYAGKNKDTFTGIDSDEPDGGEPGWMHDAQPHYPVGKSYDFNRTLDEAMYRTDLLRQRMDRIEGRKDK